MFVPSVSVKNSGTSVNCRRSHNRIGQGLDAQNTVSFKGSDPFSFPIAKFLAVLLLGSQNNAALHKGPEAAFCLSSAPKKPACEEMCRGLINETRPNMVMNLKNGVRAFCKLPVKHK